MENLTFKIICQADTSISVMNIANMPSSTSIDNSSNKLSHDTTTETGQRSNSNIPDGLNIFGISPKSLTQGPSLIE